MKNITKKKLTALLAVLCAFSLLAGCGYAAASSQTLALAPVTVVSAAGTDSAVSVPASSADGSDGSSAVQTVDTGVSGRDASGEYDAASAVALAPSGDLTITEAGVYILSGVYENVMITVDAAKEDKVQLVLAGAEITNANGPAIYVRCADKVFVTAAAGTVNSVSDGAGYTLTDGDVTLDAAIFSREDLTLNGSGSLTVNGNCRHAVVSKDDLVVTAGDLTVNAVNVGLNGKDSVRLSGAAVGITAGTDGVRAENGADREGGYVSVVDSVLTVVSGRDGIQAETDFYAENAAITVAAGGGSGVRSTAAESCKGIKAGVSLTVSGGTVRIDSRDDALHCDGTVTILEGGFTLSSGDDGIHANELADIAGGTLSIGAYEGIEATVVRIRGGQIDIQASDDGVNAGRKSAAYGTPTVEISGGTLTVTMGAGDTDGIDVNGNIVISGGTVYVNGNSAFDYDGTASFTGGSVYVNGQQVSSLPNQMMGGRMGGFGAQGGPGGWGGQMPQDGQYGRGGFGGQGGPGGHGGWGGQGM